MNARHVLCCLLALPLLHCHGQPLFAVLQKKIENSSRDGDQCALVAIDFRYQEIMELGEVFFLIYYIISFFCHMFFNTSFPPERLFDKRSFIVLESASLDEGLHQEFLHRHLSCAVVVKNGLGDLGKVEKLFLRIANKRKLYVLSQLEDMFNKNASNYEALNVEYTLLKKSGGNTVIFLRFYIPYFNQTHSYR